MMYFQTAAPDFDAAGNGGDDVDWCAAFVNYCLETAGYRGTGHPGARSFYWNKGPHFVVIPEAQKGCIAVFRDAPFTDPDWLTGTGHVGFVVGSSATTLDLLGGNQGHTVKVKTHQRQNGTGANITRKVVRFLFPVMN